MQVCRFGIIIKILAGRIYAEGLAKLIGGRVGIYSSCTQACMPDSIRPCLVYLANWNHTFASADPCTNILASCFGCIAPIHAKFDLWVVTIRSSLLGIPYTVLSKQVSRSQNCCSSPLQSYPMVYYILWISNFVRFLHKTQHPWQFNLSSHYTHWLWLYLKMQFENIRPKACDMAHSHGGDGALFVRSNIWAQMSSLHVLTSTPEGRSLL